MASTGKEFNKEDIIAEIKNAFKTKTVSKQQVYEGLIGKFGHPKEIAQILQKLPSPKAIKKYRKWNILLFVNLLLTLFGYFLLAEGKPWAMIVYYGVLLFIVALRKLKFYFFVSALSAFSILILTISVFSNPDNHPNLGQFALVILLIIVSCFLPILLAKRYCPEPILKRVDFITPLKKHESRLIFEFVE